MSYRLVELSNLVNDNIIYRYCGNTSAYKFPSVYERTHRYFKCLLSPLSVDSVANCMQTLAATKRNARLATRVHMYFAQAKRTATNKHSRPHTASA